MSVVRASSSLAAAISAWTSASARLASARASAICLLALAPGTGSLFLGLATRRAGARLRLGRARQRILGRLLRLPDRRERPLELLLRLAQPRAGILDQRRRQAEPLGDREGVGGARQADLQVVGRAQRLQVELDRGVRAVGVLWAYVLSSA